MTRPNDWHTKDDRLSDRRNLSVAAAEVKYKDHHQQRRERKRNRNASNKGCCFSVTPSTSERLLYGNGRKKKGYRNKNKTKQTSPLNKECKKRKEKKNSFDDPHSVWSVFFRLLPTQSDGPLMPGPAGLVVACQFVRLHFFLSVARLSVVGRPLRPHPFSHSYSLQLRHVYYIDTVYIFTLFHLN